MAPHLVITSLHTYPVKSAAAIDLTASTLTPRGLEFDREWVVTDEDGAMLTQRDHPRLALIHPELRPDRLRLSGPSIKFVDVPFDRTNGREAIIDVWGTPCPGIHQGEDAHRWLSEFLETGAHLYRRAAQFARPLDTRFVGTAAAHSAFADSLPLSLVTTESVAEVDRVRRELGLSRATHQSFRANVVVAGGNPFEEDEWPALETLDGRVKLDFPAATIRCQVINVDQETGNTGAGNTRALGLSALNRLFRSTRDGEQGLFFGLDGVASRGIGGTLRAGDHLRVSDLSDGFPPLPRLKSVGETSE